jgi:hypothetical protein
MDLTSQLLWKNLYHLQDKEIDMIKKALKNIKVNVNMLLKN